MYSLQLPPDPNAKRHTEDHREPPSGSLRDIVHDYWSAVLRLLTPTGRQASYKSSSTSSRRIKYVELRAKNLARNRRTGQ